MKRPFVALCLALAAIGLFTGGLAYVLDGPRAKPGASRVERLFVGRCAHCHGEDGRGSWRATMYLIRPGDLTDRERMRQHSDRYLFDIVRYGGSPIGRPGMPGFEDLSDQDVSELVRYLRTLSGSSRSGSAGHPRRLAAPPA